LQTKDEIELTIKLIEWKSVLGNVNIFAGTMSFY